VRWDSSNNIINKDPDWSDKYYFNKGYFIAKSESQSLENVLTIND
jgi:hypothetical protein